MSESTNIAQQEALGEAIGNGEIDRLDEFFAEGSVDHDPAPDQQQGPEGFKDFFRTMRSAFPDLDLQVDKMVTDSDHVVIAYTLTGTQQGEFQGLDPTNRRVEVRGVQIGRFEDGKIIERWGATDELSMLKQLGVSPAGG